MCNLRYEINSGLGRMLQEIQQNIRFAACMEEECCISCNIFNFGQIFMSECCIKCRISWLDVQFGHKIGKTGLQTLGVCFRRQLCTKFFRVLVLTKH